MTLFAHIDSELRRRRDEQDINQACERYGGHAERLFENVEKEPRRALKFFGYWLPWLIQKDIIHRDSLEGCYPQELAVGNILYRDQGDKTLQGGKHILIDSTAVATGLTEVFAFGCSNIESHDFCSVTTYDDAFASVKGGYITAFNKSVLNISGEVIATMYDKSTALISGDVILKLYDEARVIQAVSSSNILAVQTEKP